MRLFVFKTRNRLSVSRAEFPFALRNLACSGDKAPFSVRNISSMVWISASLRLPSVSLLFRWPWSATSPCLPTRLRSQTPSRPVEQSAHPPIFTYLISSRYSVSQSFNFNFSTTPSICFSTSNCPTFNCRKASVSDKIQNWNSTQVEKPGGDRQAIGVMKLATVHIYRQLTACTCLLDLQVCLVSLCQRR